MTIQSLNDVRHSFLTVRSDIKLRENFELRMLEENRIDGILPMTVCDNDGILDLNYDITGMLPLSEVLLNRRLTGGDIRHIVLSLKHILTGLGPFLLSGTGMILSAESVYTDPVTLSPYFLYLPGRDESFSSSLTDLLEHLMAAVDHDDYDSVVLAYRLYKESQDDVNAIDHLEQLLISPDSADARNAGPPVPDREIPSADSPVISSSVIVENIPAEKSGHFLERLFRKGENKIPPPAGETLTAEETKWLEEINSN